MSGVTDTDILGPAGITTDDTSMKRATGAQREKGGEDMVNGEP